MENLYNLFKQNYYQLKKYKLIIIANVRGRTCDFKNYKLRKANENEFFSDEEYKEIFNGIKKLDIYTKIYYNELDFIDDLINNKYKSLNNIIVFNFARNGVIEGKKSLIPSICDLMNIKYTTSNAFIQSLCRNKYIWGNNLKKEGIPVLNNYLVQNGKILNNLNEIKMDDLYIMKPLAESSSIGITIQKSFDKLINESKNNSNEKFIIQKYLNGIEIEVPFFELNNEYYILEPTIIIYDEKVLNENLSLQNSYHYEKCNLSNKKITIIKKIAKQTAILLNMKKYGRIDFKLDENGNPYVIDIATLPYLTKKSSFAFQFKNLNINYENIFAIILIIAILHN